MQCHGKPIVGLTPCGERPYSEAIVLRCAIVHSVMTDGIRPVNLDRPGLLFLRSPRQIMNLMMAMRAQFDHDTCAFEADELHCWYNVKGVADFAFLAAEAAEADIDLTASQLRDGTPPVTPKSHHSVAVATWAEARCILPNRHPTAELHSAAMKADDKANCKNVTLPSRPVWPCDLPGPWHLSKLTLDLCWLVSQASSQTTDAYIVDASTAPSAAPLAIVAKRRACCGDRVC